MRVQTVLATGVAMLLMAGGPRAQRSQMLVTPEWLGQHLSDPNLVILHFGPKAEYDEKHIAGARYATLNDLARPRAEGDLNLEMLPADGLRQALASFGVSDDSRIVLVFGGTSLTSVTRAAFTMDYAGLGARTSVLDGGLGAWVRAGLPVTADVPAPKPGTLSPLTLRPIVVTADDVVRQLSQPNVAVVDARLTDFYTGARVGGGQNPHKTGHITGAHSVPFTEIADENLTLKSPAELEGIFTNAGVKPGDTVIGYCHLGQQATAMLFAARSLGYTVRLYDGSFEDWSRRDLPVTATIKKP